MPKLNPRQVSAESPENSPPAADEQLYQIDIGDGGIVTTFGPEGLDDVLQMAREHLTEPTPPWLTESQMAEKSSVFITRLVSKEVFDEERRAAALGRELLEQAARKPECVRAAARGTSSRELAELLEGLVDGGDQGAEEAG